MVCLVVLRCNIKYMDTVYIYIYISRFGIDDESPAAKVTIPAQMAITGMVPARLETPAPLARSMLASASTQRMPSSARNPASRQQSATCVADSRAEAT